MGSVKEYFSSLGKGVVSLVKGLEVTGKEFVTPKITERYPEDRDNMHVESKMVDTWDGKKKKKLDRYVYDLGSCTFCQLCVTSCPTNALRFSNDFEQAVFTREKLVKQLNYLPEKPEPEPTPEQRARFEEEKKRKAEAAEAAAAAPAAAAPELDEKAKKALAAAGGDPEKEAKKAAAANTNDETKK